AHCGRGFARSLLSEALRGGHQSLPDRARQGDRKGRGARHRSSQRDDLQHRSCGGRLCPRLHDTGPENRSARQVSRTSPQGGAVMHSILAARTDFSLGESILSVENLVDTAAAMGAKAVGILDTMTVTGMIDLTKRAKTKEIKPVVGVRLRLTSDPTWRPAA